MSDLCGCARDDWEAAIGLAWAGLCGESSLLRLLGDMGPGDVWRASKRQLTERGVNDRTAAAFVERRQRFDLSKAKNELARSGLRFVPYGASSYPGELLHLECPPAGLFLRGLACVLDELATSARITIVGTRKATAEGLRAAEVFARAFSSHGVLVMSGMAIGVDGQAHKAALAGGGHTVAVLGCGADVIYPPRHRRLYEEIVEKGIVASELPPGFRPSRWTFPHRNRLLAALGDAVLVVEGSITSGALQTAKWALELGRPIFSVPGSIFREGSQGCNALLHEGAVPALSPEVVVEDFLLQTRIERGARGSPMARRTVSGEQLALQVATVVSCEGRRVMEALQAEPASVDRLIAVTGMSAREVGAALGELEARALVVRGGPGMYVRGP